MDSDQASEQVQLSPMAREHGNQSSDVVELFNRSHEIPIHEREDLGHPIEKSRGSLI
jgi:hypothetical protein